MKVNNTSIYQGGIKLIKGKSNDTYNFTSKVNAAFFNFLFIKGIKMVQQELMKCKEVYSEKAHFYIAKMYFLKTKNNEKVLFFRV